MSYYLHLFDILRAHEDFLCDRTSILYTWSLKTRQNYVLYRKEMYCFNDFLDSFFLSYADKRVEFLIFETSFL